MKTTELKTIRILEGISEKTNRWIRENVFCKNDPQGDQYNFYCVEGLAEDIAGEYYDVPAEIEEEIQMVIELDAVWIELPPLKVKVFSKLQYCRFLNVFLIEGEIFHKIVLVLLSQLFCPKYAGSFLAP